MHGKFAVNTKHFFIFFLVIWGKSMKPKLLAALLCLVSAQAAAEELVVKMMDLNTRKAVGTVTIKDTPYGAVFTPKLHGLASGVHGFHVHTNGSCGTTYKDGKRVLGGAAGGHFDPEETNRHGYPWTDYNHLGDLPAVYVDAKGHAKQPVLAPRLEVEELRGRALMIHFGGDNYSDHPKPLGGGGARMVCGVI